MEAVFPWEGSTAYAPGSTRTYPDDAGAAGSQLLLALLLTTMCLNIALNLRFCSRLCILGLTTLGGGGGVTRVETSWVCWATGLKLVWAALIGATWSSVSSSIMIALWNGFPGALTVAAVAVLFVAGSPSVFSWPSSIVSTLRFSLARGVILFWSSKTGRGRRDAHKGTFSSTSDSRASLRRPFCD